MALKSGFEMRSCDSERDLLDWGAKIIGSRKLLKLEVRLFVSSSRGRVTQPLSTITTKPKFQLKASRLAAKPKPLYFRWC